MVVPSKTYFPTTLQDRAAWYDNLDKQAQLTGVLLGLTAAEVAQIHDDNLVFQFLATADITVDTYDDMIRKYRKTITENGIGDPTPDFPPNIDLKLPVVIPTGMFERLDDYVRRIRGAANYTPEVGAAYRIIPSTPDSLIPAVAHAKLSAEPRPNSIVRVKFVRGKSAGMLIQTAIDKGEWGGDEKAVKSPVDLHVPQNEKGLPRMVEIRARFLDGNNPTGDWSDVITVQTIP